MQTFHPYQSLEQPLEHLAPESERPVARLKRVWQSWLNFWSSPPREPRIRRKTDRSGNTYWRVHDPVRDDTVWFDDEQKVMVWLDEQRYRRLRPGLLNFD